MRLLHAEEEDICWAMAKLTRNIYYHESRLVDLLVLANRVVRVVIMGTL
jgi:hypothetical protein